MTRMAFPTAPARAARAGARALAALALCTAWTFAAPASASAAPKIVPGHIEAEAYDAAFGVQTERTEDEGGGLDVGFISAGSWMEYQVDVQTTGRYTVALRVASPTGVSNAIQLLNGDTVLATFDVPTTQSWQSWTTISRNVPLEAGVQTLRLVALRPG